MATTTGRYRSQDGRHLFGFRIVEENGRYRLFCTSHPGLAGRDPSAQKTHLYSSGEVCFQAGMAPRSRAEAERRATQWAEYFLHYRATGKSGG